MRLDINYSVITEDGEFAALGFDVPFTEAAEAFLFEAVEDHRIVNSGDKDRPLWVLETYENGKKNEYEYISDMKGEEDARIDLYRDFILLNQSKSGLRIVTQEEAEQYILDGEE